MRWVKESDGVIASLEQHGWWQRHPKQLRENVRKRAEEHAAREGKTTVYQQHVLRAAADVAEGINNAIWERRQQSGV